MSYIHGHYTQWFHRNQWTREWLSSAWRLSYNTAFPHHHHQVNYMQHLTCAAKLLLCTMTIPSCRRQQVY